MTGDHASLPPIGSPATRALESVGVTRLEQLRHHREEDLLALHGVGPKAISLLRAALAERGMSFLGANPERKVPRAVQQYIDALDPAHRRLFDRLQQLVLDEVPEAEVVLSYQIPLYRVGRRHVGLQAGRADGVTLTATSPDHIDAFRQRHPQFTTNKASIQFRLDDELPDDAIRDVVRRAVRS